MDIISGEYSRMCKFLIFRGVRLKNFTFPGIQLSNLMIQCMYVLLIFEAEIYISVSLTRINQISTVVYHILWRKAYINWNYANCLINSGYRITRKRFNMGIRNWKLVHFTIINEYILIRSKHHPHQFFYSRSAWTLYMYQCLCL